VRALVRAHHARLVRLEGDGTEKGAPLALDAVGQREGLRPGHQLGLGALQHAVALPGGDEAGDLLVADLRQDEPDRVVRAHGQEPAALLRRDDVVRRGEEGAERTGGIGVLERAEWSDVGHGRRLYQRPAAPWGSRPRRALRCVT